MSAVRRITEPPGDRPLTVAVVNDHELIVRGVAAMLAPYKDVIEVVELDLDVPVTRAVDIALYDTFTCTNLGSEDLDDLCENPLVGRVVLYTWLLTEDLVDSALRKGVHCALHKSLDAEDLVAALLSAQAQSVEIVPFAEEPTLASNSWPGRDLGLTARESEIIALVTAGLSNNEIAERTYLSINSVKSYIRTAYRTMGVTSRSRAVLWGIDHGMAPTRMRVLLPSTGTDDGSTAFASTAETS
ncbi:MULTISPECIES: response regulator transcription factor [unclassified Knoellia]|uniref:response regulator transcription factor n=1 Tax=Knoellia altitudinis TaxID=3404795 RepID=UPI0036082AB4